MVYDNSGVIIKCENFKDFLNNINDYNNLILEQLNDDNTDCSDND